jgi:hypothetical protein
MNSKQKRLLISLHLGLLLILTSLGVFVTLSKDVTFGSLAIYAAGPRYVVPAPLGSNSGNCLNPLAPCATVQYAVDQSTSGDEIRVAAGTYTGVFTRAGYNNHLVAQSVYISKSIAIRGGYTTTNWTIANPIANPTTLDAQGAGRVFNIEAPPVVPYPAIVPISVTISGLRIINGNAIGQDSANNVAGGGIQAFGITGTIQNNYIANNNGALSGGGVLLVASGPTKLVNNTIVNNVVDVIDNLALGGGVALAAYPDVNTEVSFTGNIIQGNMVRATGITVSPDYAAKGGGIYVQYANKLTIEDNIIQANQAEGIGTAVAYGGGIYFNMSSPIMTNTVIIDNRILGQGSGAGGFIFGGKANLFHTTIARNSGGDGSGFGISAPDPITSLVTLTNTILVSHTLGITASASSTITLKGILWFSNGSNTAGAGIFNRSSEFSGNPIFTFDGYHLGPGSAAIDRGVSTGLTTDIDSESRSLAFPDLGADEIISFQPLYLPLILQGS